MNLNITLAFLLITLGVIGLAFFLYFALAGTVMIGFRQGSDKLIWTVITYAASFSSLVCIAAILFGIYSLTKIIW